MNARTTRRSSSRRRSFLLSEKAVSTVIGTVMMVAITVAVFGGVATVVLNEVSESQDTNSSQVVAKGRGSTSLVLAHNGGEAVPLTTGNLLLVVDGASTSIPLTNFAAQTEDGTNWVIGETLCIMGSGTSCSYPSGTNITAAQVAVGNTLIMNYGESVGLIQATGPDLKVTAVSTTPTNPAEGNSVDFLVSVKNIGNENLGTLQSFVVQLRIGGSPIDSDTIVGLNAGQTKQVTLNWPSAVAGGNPYTVTADDTGQITETSEANNVFSSTLSVSSPSSPDLEVISVVKDISSPNPTDVVTFTATIRNNGPDPIGGTFDVALFMDGSGTASSTSTYSSGLANGATDTVTLTWTAATRGVTHTSLVRIDSGAAITESNEGNNDLAGPSVTLASVDLTLSVTSTPSGVTAPNSATFTATVSNSGPGNILASESFTVTLDMTSIGSGTEDSITINSGLASGASTGTLTLTWTPTTSGSNQPYIITTDAGGIITESAEGNNAASGTINIANAGGTPDPNPNFPFEDVNGDMAFLAADGDIQRTAADVQSGFSTTNGLVIPAGSVTFGSPNNLVFTAGGAGLRIDEGFATNGDFTLTTTSGNIWLKSGVTYSSKTTGNNNDALIQSAGQIYADGAVVIGDNQLRFQAVDHIHLNYAHLHSDSKVQLNAPSGKVVYIVGTQFTKTNGDAPPATPHYTLSGGATTQS